MLHFRRRAERRRRLHADVAPSLTARQDVLRGQFPGLLFLNSRPFLFPRMQIAGRGGLFLAMWQHRRRPLVCKECRDVSRQLSIASIAAQAVSRNDACVENHSLQEAFRRSAIERRGEVFLEKSPEREPCNFYCCCCCCICCMSMKGTAGAGGCWARSTSTLQSSGMGNWRSRAGG
jgi:hypothetical protein